MTDSLEHIEVCPTCGVSIDTSAFEPLSRVSCPECGSPMIVGQYIAHYELIEAVGRGGMGVVYKARDTSLDRYVALKVLRKDHSQHAEFIAQLETEAAITASINHPYVVRVFTTGTDAGRFYIAMELVDKGTLDDLIGLQGQVAEAQVLEIAIQIAQGLRAAYQHGLIHRDVKPGNILFADAHTAKIVDFGLAMLEAASQGGGEVWGTPYYVAPEKLDRKPEDFRSDMYSLGATLFHALAGRPPYEAKDASMVALKHLKSQSVSLQAFAPHVSSSTAYVINRTLLKDPDQRYQSYDEFIEHLEYAKSELEKKSNQPQAKQRVVLETDADQKMMSYVTFGMLGLAVLAGLGGWWYFRSKSESAGNNSNATPAAQSVTAGIDPKLTSQYSAARKQMMEGKPADAANRFRSLGLDKKTPSPLAEWSIVHWGLSELLAGEPIESRTAFSTLQKRDLSSPALKRGDLGSILGELARLASSDDAVPAASVKDFSRENAGAIAPLIIGLKDWAAADFDAAGPLLRQFQTTVIEKGEYAWISEYRPLIEDHIADFADYREMSEALKMVKNKEDESRALETIAKTRGKLRTKGPLIDRFDRLALDLKGKVDARSKDSLRNREADLANLGRTRWEIAEAAKSWKFSAARELAEKVQLTSDDARRARASILIQLEVLQKWKDLVIADLNANAARVTLKRRDGSDIKPFAKASQDGAEVSGSAVVRWDDVSPDSVLSQMAALARPDAAPAEASKRKWFTAAFASMSGSPGAELLAFEAAKLNPDLLNEIPLIVPSLRATGENLAKGKTVTASGFVKTEQFDESPAKALDSDPKTKWCAKETGPKWLQVDLGSPARICRWVVHHASSGGESEEMNTVDYELQSSENGNDWKAVDKVVGNRSEVTARSVPTFLSRYIRLAISKPGSRSNDPAARIVDFSIQGPSTSKADPDSVKHFFESDGWVPVPLFTSVDIGKVEQRGTTHLSDRHGEYSMRVSGDDIWKSADAFRFAARKLKGDGEIIARVVSVENVHEWVKAGLMFRESLAPNSANVLLALTPAPKITVQTRGAAGTDTTSQPSEAPHAAPMWLRFVRQGSKFTAYTSDDGIRWTEGKSTTAQLPAEVYAGLALCSHVNATVAAAKFDFVRIIQKDGSEGASAPAPRP